MMLLAPFTLRKTPIYIPQAPASILALSALASRTSGVAPLAVFFDATGTVSSATAKPFHDIFYLWDFGDVLGSPVSGTDWTTGNLAIASRNVGFGPCAGHLFERPGTYQVAVQVSDGISVQNTSITITVTDPDVVFSGANTICVSCDTLPVAGVNGVPAGATCAVNASFPSITSTYCLTGKCVLLKRGDTFNTDVEYARLGQTGPGILGAYGTGADPLIQQTKAVPGHGILGISSPTTPEFYDWRVMDLDFDGMLKDGSNGPGHTGLSGGHYQTLLLRITCRNMDTCYGFSSEIPNYWNNNTAYTTHTVDQLAIVDCISVPGVNAQYTGYNAGNRVMFMGNYFDNGSIQARRNENGDLIGDNGSHVLRFPSLRKAVICNNTLRRPGGTRLSIKIHAPIWTAKTGEGGVPTGNYSAAMDGSGYTELVNTYGNLIEDDVNPWAASFGPQNGSNEEPVRNVLFDMNHVKGCPTSQIAVQAHCRSLTVRNTLYESTSTVAMRLVDVGVFGVETPANDIRVYNNSAYSNAVVPNGAMAFTNVSSATVSNIVTSNNLGYAPNAINPVPYVVGGASGVSGVNNSTTAQINGTIPFAAVPPVSSADWKPLSASYAIGGGVAVPVWRDFAGVVRVLPNDIGAYQH